MSSTTQVELNLGEKIERRITKRLVRDIIAKDGVSLHVRDEESACIHDQSEASILEAMFESGENYLVIRDRDLKKLGWIRLIWGNETDVISDYSDNEFTRAIVEPVYQWIESNEFLD